MQNASWKCWSSMHDSQGVISSNILLEMSLMSESQNALHGTRPSTWAHSAPGDILSWVSLLYLGACSGPSPFWRWELASTLVWFLAIWKVKGNGEVWPWASWCQPRAVECGCCTWKVSSLPIATAPHHHHPPHTSGTSRMTRVGGHKGCWWKMCCSYLT